MYLVFGILLCKNKATGDNSKTYMNSKVLYEYEQEFRIIIIIIIIIEVMW